MSNDSNFRLLGIHLRGAVKQYAEKCKDLLEFVSKYGPDDFEVPPCDMITDDLKSLLSSIEGQLETFALRLNAVNKSETSEDGPAIPELLEKLKASGTLDAFIQGFNSSAPDQVREIVQNWTPKADVTLPCDETPSDSEQPSDPVEEGEEDTHRFYQPMRVVASKGERKDWKFPEPIEKHSIADEIQKRAVDGKYRYEYSRMPLSSHVFESLMRGDTWVFEGRDVGDVLNYLAVRFGEKQEWWEMLAEKVKCHVAGSESEESTEEQGQAEKETDDNSPRSDWMYHSDPAWLILNMAKCRGWTLRQMCELTGLNHELVWEMIVYRKWPDECRFKEVLCPKALERIFREWNEAPEYRSKEWGVKLPNPEASFPTISEAMRNEAEKRWGDQVERGLSKRARDVELFSQSDLGEFEVRRLLSHDLGIDHWRRAANGLANSLGHDPSWWFEVIARTALRQGYKNSTLPTNENEASRSEASNG
ncbi:hypothetical protein KOR42_23500 [Thalassoglobus neptunius]|uniref:Uncharacterized protein n=1 Tax=Thalassoglobus neptunius TaxID=1938619 RepID=A0A5C5X9H2_9PLAN|nr:hypothetical protein [Thalassoglobus neptunius]TWT58963.1 hypothetical protein KOR42_23500 [Thalassoglobus neptunius]